MVLFIYFLLFQNALLQDMGKKCEISKLRGIFPIHLNSIILLPDAFG